MEPTLEQAIRQMLLSFSAVTAHTEQRIRPEFLDRDDELPAILFGVEEETLHDDIEGRGGLITARVLIEVIDYTRLASRALEQAVRTNNTDPGTGLQGYRGQVGPFLIDGATLARRKPFFVERETDEDRNWFGIGCSYDIDYREVT